MGSNNNSKYSRNKRMKYIILFFCLTGFTLSQTDELAKAKDALAEQAIIINELRKANKDLNEMAGAFILDLQAIENPSEELITVLKKYGLYNVPERKE